MSSVEFMVSPILSKMRTDVLEGFVDRYNDVFDTDGSIRVCGRAKCSALIGYAYELVGSSIEFGSIDRGYMNVDNIKELHDAVQKEISSRTAE